MRVLITGAAGHIGSFLSLSLRDKDYTLVLIDDLSSERYCSFMGSSGTNSGDLAQTKVQDILDWSFLEKVDRVIHLAALTNAEASVGRAETLRENNLGASRVIGEQCAKFGIPLLFISSTSVYGQSEGRVFECADNRNVYPQSPYAEVKLEEEALLKKIAEESGLELIIMRFGTIVGISPGMRFHTAVNKFCWQAATGQPLTVWETAMNQVRPYLALPDALDAIELFLSRELKFGETYNVLSENMSVRIIVDSIREWVPDLQIKYVSSKIMNQLSYEVSFEKISSFGFKSNSSISLNIAETLHHLGIRSSK